VNLPILVENASEVARRLRRWSIPAIAWWSGYHRGCVDWDSFPEACYLKDHVLALPVHQQLDVPAIEYMARKVLECLGESKGL
jgi:hypothetical protein